MLFFHSTFICVIRITEYRNVRNVLWVKRGKARDGNGTFMETRDVTEKRGQFSHPDVGRSVTLIVDGQDGLSSIRLVRGPTKTTSAQLESRLLLSSKNALSVLIAPAAQVITERLINKNWNHDDGYPGR